MMISTPLDTRLLTVITRFLVSLFNNIWMEQLWIYKDKKKFEKNCIYIRKWMVYIMLQLFSDLELSLQNQHYIILCIGKGIRIAP